jgi:hypothetical protein
MACVMRVRSQPLTVAELKEQLRSRSIPTFIL